MDTRMVSLMKWLKDKMDDPPSDEELKTLAIRSKGIGATHNEVATVIAHKNFVPITDKATKIIHDNGLLITFRNAHMNMEFERKPDGTFTGLYGSEAWIGGRRKDPQIYLDAAKSMILDHPDWYKDGDEFAIYPERTEGIFTDNTAWLWPNSPENFGNFFVKLFDITTEAFKQINKKVHVGMTANNGSELLNGWIPHFYVQKVGYVVMDHYLDNRDPAKYEEDIRKVYQKYGKPVYVQEWAFNRNHSDEAGDVGVMRSYYDMFDKVKKENILKKFGYWGGWSALGEGIFNNDLTINWKGQLLKEFFVKGNGSVPPIEPPMPPTEPPSNGKELLESPWKLEGDNGSSEKDRAFNDLYLKGIKHVEVTLNLHGTKFGLGLDEASVIFIQDNIWYLSNVVMLGKNGFDGEQKIVVPLEKFRSVNDENKLDGEKLISNVHARFWNSGKFVVDIKSVKLVGEIQVPPEPPTPPIPPTPPNEQVITIDPSKVKEIKIILK